MANKELYKKALEAIQDLFSDMSVSRRKAVGNLQQLQGEIDMMISALEADEEREAEAAQTLEEDEEREMLHDQARED